MKKDKLQKVSRFLKEVFKNPWSYFGGILFLIFGLSNRYIKYILSDIPRAFSFHYRDVFVAIIFIIFVALCGMFIFYCVKKYIKDINNLLKKSLKNKWSYLCGILFIYFGGSLFIATEGFGSSGMIYGLEPFLLFISLSTTWNYAINYILLLPFFFLLGIVSFQGLKNKSSWAWTICFFVLLIQICSISIEILNFTDNLVCDSPYICSGDSANEYLFNRRNDNPYALILLMLILAIFFFMYVLLYVKKEKYNIENILFNIIFWSFNVIYPIFIIYVLFWIFTTERLVAG